MLDCTSLQSDVLFALGVGVGRAVGMGVEPVISAVVGGAVMMVVSGAEMISYIFRQLNKLQLKKGVGVMRWKTVHIVWYIFFLWVSH